MLKGILAALSAVLLTVSVNVLAQSPADLKDLEIAHVAYTANTIDIRYAHLALAISTNPEIQAFAQTMVHDHSAVNDRVLALVTKLRLAPQDNFLSRRLNEQADQLVREMSQLSGEAFDRRYAENEFGYHRAVNGLVEGTFIPNLEHPEVRALIEETLLIFRAHEKHAEMMVAALEKQGS